MDGPFFFGYYVSAKSCHYSIADVAHRAAETFKQIQKFYPNVKIMDAEGPGPTPVATWLPEFKQWLSAFASESGHQIDAVGMDLHWNDAWHTGYDVVDAIRQTTIFLHQHGVKAGLYVNAPDAGVDNVQWMNGNREHLRIAAGSGVDLDFLYIASWMKFPLYNLPETDTSAYTSLVNDAFSIFGGHQ